MTISLALSSTLATRKLTDTLSFCLSDFLKWEPEYLDSVAAVKQVWADAGRPYEPASAVPWREIVESGRTKPDRAKVEKERQKALGWDV